MKDMKIILPVGCNAKCPFCFWEKQDFCKDDYIARLRLAIDTLVKEDSIVANISGGETTLYKKLPLLLDNLKTINKIKKIILTTNGSKLLPLISELKGKVNHINISRHHYEDKINDSLFGIHFDIDYKKITYELNKIGIDVRVNCVLTDKINNVCDLNNMIEWATKNGFNSIKFRNDFAKGIEMSDLEKQWREIYSPINESSCPVCRQNTYLNKTPVLFGYGVSEPSDTIEDYEYIFTQSGKLCYDYQGKKEVKQYKTIREYLPTNYTPCGIYTDTGCGRYIQHKISKPFYSLYTAHFYGCGSSGCGSSYNSNFGCGVDGC